MHTTEKLAELALSIGPRDIPPAVAAAANRCILDLIAAACAGHEAPSARAMHRTVRKIFGKGPSPVWCTDIRVPAAAAAMANAASASALDLDDGHRGAAGHPGASIIPAVFAVAWQTGASDQEITAALTAGYEIACRIGAARNFSRLPTLSTGRWCAYGVAAAAGKLYRFSAPVLAQALAVAGSQVPDLAASGYSQVMGNHVKEGIPWSTFLGLVAADLAREGFTGPLDILDHPDYFQTEQLSAAARSTSWAIQQIYFKPYSSCRWSHAAIDALSAILSENRLAASSIEGISVQTFERALRLNNYPDPDTIEGAQYSIPFSMAAAAVKGKDALLPLTESLLHDPAVVDLARRITLTSDASLDARFPRQTPARIIVQTFDGREIEKCVMDPKGDPANPMTDEELAAKFCRLTLPCLSPEHQQQILSTPFSFFSARSDGF